MSGGHRRGARRELEAAKVLGSERVHRRRYERAPDLMPVRLASGDVLTVECKTGRARLPAVVRDALKQAAGYLPSAIPLAVISSTGGAAVACMYLRDLARVLGIEPKKTAQLSIAPTEDT